MEEKINRPKLTLSKNVVNKNALEKLKALAGGVTTLSSKHESKEHPVIHKIDAKTIQKIKKESQKNKLNAQLITSNKNATDNAKAKNEDNKKLEESYEVTETVNLARVEDRAAKEKKQNQPEQKQNDKHKEYQQNNKKEKKLEEKKNISFKGMLSKLRQLYPITFPADETKIVALKVGINKDIIKDLELMKNLRTSITYLGKFLKWYTSSRNYRTLTQVEGNNRYDLAGQAVDVVTKEQALDAKKRLDSFRGNENKNNI